MFEIIEDPEFIFKYLDENFRYNLQLNEDQYFIFTNSSFFLVIYSKQGETEKLIAFKLDSRVNQHQAAMSLLQHLEQTTEFENPVYRDAIEALHVHILNMNSSLLFFDAH